MNYGYVIVVTKKELEQMAEIYKTIKKLLCGSALIA
jgi:hypothetical protein